jgi:hypothetical protein
MPTRTRWLAAPLLALALTVACTSDGDASPQTYFEGLEAAKQQHGEALSHELAGLPSAEVVQLLRQENEAIGDFISQLEDLDVPDSLEEAHTLALGLTQQRLSIQEEIARSYFDPTRSDLEARDYLRVTVPRREDARQLWYGAICALEQDAREQDIAINLGCTPEQALALRAVERLDVTLPTGANACQQASEPRTAQVEVG